MTKETETNSEVSRLENLWGGEFGDAYVDRNRTVGNHRGPFWKKLMVEFPIKKVLEVGCNLGENLRWIASSLDPRNVYGVDINLKALSVLHTSHPEINSLWSPARDLPFRDCYFDLTFTMGVLIHQPEDTLPLVMAEVVRCSRRYILCAEYFSEHTIEVPYHKQMGALFKRNYGFLYTQLFPNLKNKKEGFLSKQEGWDDVNYWIFEKQE